jgi:peroxisomal 2,4-dienoyl-CoA reductase
LERLLPSDAKAAYTKAQPLGRFGHVRDIADATVYLFSDGGSYVTGQTLVGKSNTLSVIESNRVQCNLT